MRKLAVLAVAVPMVVAVWVATVYYSPDDRGSWPLSEDPVCASVMASRPPDLVLASDEFDSDAISSSPAWDNLGTAHLPTFRIAGYLHRELMGLTLYRSYNDVFSVATAPNTPTDDVTFLPLPNAVISTWGSTVPVINGRCVVIDGGHSDWSAFGEVRRLSVWVDPHRPVADFSLVGAIE